MNLRDDGYRVWDGEQCVFEYKYSEHPRAQKIVQELLAASSRLDTALEMCREIEFFLRGHPGEASVLRAKIVKKVLGGGGGFESRGVEQKADPAGRQKPTAPDEHGVPTAHLSPSVVERQNPNEG